MLPPGFAPGAGAACGGGWAPEGQRHPPPDSPRAALPLPRRGGRAALAGAAIGIAAAGARPGRRRSHAGPASDFEAAAGSASEAVGEGRPPGFEIERSEAEWAKVLGRREYGILRMKGTEVPTSHRFDRYMPEQGHFACGACSLPLYPASAKFLSTTGWPSFSACYYSEEAGGCHVAPQPDRGAYEITCARCGSHLGHIFFDAKSNDNLRGERHCANGLSLTYEEAGPEGWALREEGIDMRNAGPPLPGRPRGSCCVM